MIKNSLLGYGVQMYPKLLYLFEFVSWSFPCWNLGSKMTQIFVLCRNSTAISMLRYGGFSVWGRRLQRRRWTGWKGTVKLKTSSLILLDSGYWAFSWIDGGIVCLSKLQGDRIVDGKLKTCFLKPLMDLGRETFEPFQGRPGDMSDGTAACPFIRGMIVMLIIFNQIGPPLDVTGIFNVPHPIFHFVRGRVGVWHWK